MNAVLRSCACLLALTTVACAPTEQERAADPAVLAAVVDSVVTASGAEVGVYYRSLAPGGDSLALHADLRMHAASTMKVPVMMRLFLDEAEGLRSLADSVAITRTFRSIVDGSDFELPMDSDSDTTYYGRVGERVPMRDLVDRMITWSSNLATNIVIQEAGAERVTAMLREMRADSMEVLRGVEDTKAFEAGLSNTTTARDLGVVMAQVAQGERFSPEQRSEMLAILERQHFRENIPAGLPGGTRVANKTGSITGHTHDAAVVFPTDAPPYVLAVLVRGIEEQERAAALAAHISRRVWEHHLARHAAQGAR
ncbi:MAG: serine hydrolase [Longimicrobiales bacterium]